MITVVIDLGLLVVGTGLLLIGRIGSWMEQVTLHALLVSVLLSSGFSWLDWNQRRCSPQLLLRLVVPQRLLWGMSLAPM